MRRSHALNTVLGLIAAMSLFGCGGDEVTPFGDATWRIWCPSGLGGCTPGDRVDLFAFDGDDSVGVSCNANTVGENLSTSFRLQITDTNGYHEINVQGLTTGTDGGPVTAGRVTFTDGGNTYQARSVNANAPTADVPCQANLSIDRAHEAGPQLQVSLLCVDVASPSNPTRLRRTLGNFNTSTEAAILNIHNCPGI